MAADSTVLNKSYLDSSLHDAWVNIHSNEVFDLDSSLNLLQQGGFIRAKVDHGLDSFLIDEVEDHGVSGLPKLEAA